MIGLTYRLGRVIYATGNSKSEVTDKLRGSSDFEEGADVIYISGVSTGLIDVEHFKAFTPDPLKTLVKQSDGPLRAA